MKYKRFSLRYRRNKFLVTITVLIFALAFLVVLGCYKETHAYLHPIRRTATGDFLKANNVQYQDVEFTAKDGVKLSAWYTPPKNGVVILVAHGYGNQRLEDYYALFASHGYGVLAWDFRAHGKSGGEFTSIGYYEVLDAKAALDYALAQPDVKHVGAWGASMGAVTIIRAAAQYPQIEAVASDSAFSTLVDETDLFEPFPIIHSLIRFFAEQQTGLSLDLIRPVDDIGKISPRPVLIIQSSNDVMIPLDSGLRLFEAANEPKELWVKDKATHLEVYNFYPAEYTEKVIGFFDKYLVIAHTAKSE